MSYTYAQGEIFGRKLESLPENLIPFCENNENGDWVIAHSESGNNHLLEGEGVEVLEKPEHLKTEQEKGVQILYAIVENPQGFAVLKQSGSQPHAPHRLENGVHEFRIAREFDPLTKQARRVAD